MESERFFESSEEDEQDAENQESSEEEWTECSSYTFNSDSDSTIPDWEPFVDDLTGELLYIECHPFVIQNNKGRTPEFIEPFSKTQHRRSTRGKFLRLIRRRESKRKSKKNQKTLDVTEISTSKVKFQDLQEGEEKEVVLDIDTENRHNLSSEKSLAESLLGLIVGTLSDGSRVMIAGFSYDSKAKHERNIKIGDWLKSINNIDVNVQNLEDVLQKLINKDSVLLKLQRVTGVEVTKDPPINELNNESNFVKELLSFDIDKDELFLLNLCKHPAAVVFIDTDKLKESNHENEDVIYCFPRPMQKNLLCTSRGMYITLNHLLSDITKTKPTISTINYNGRCANITYSTYDKTIFLFMLPDDQASLQEIVLINNQLLRVLKFLHGSIENCFNSQNHSQLDHFFSRLFARYLNGGQWITAQQFVESQNSSESGMNMKMCQFDELVMAAPILVLPDEAQVQIDDALTELEASDYREWNEEPLDCQRLFTILGSALFHSGYLLVTHLIHEDLSDVYCFCEQLGLFHLSKTEPIKSLVMWKEVFPSSCKMQNSQVVIPDGKRYILVVGSGKELLTVIMEAGGCTEPPEDNLGPDAFYVEEVQATLAHIQELGLSEYIERFISANQDSQIAIPHPMLYKRKTDFMNLTFSKINQNFKDTSNIPKKNEVTSILKRRSADQSYLTQYTSNNSLLEDSFDAQSEESGSQGGCSEISDETKKVFSKSRGDSEDDSDGDEYGGESQISGSSFDVSEIRQSLLTDTDDYRPVQFTSGNEKMLYYFIHLDAAQSILLCPVEIKISSFMFKIIINNFKKCCQKIHSLFENTLRFKNVPAQDVSKSLMNKSLIAIKEQGVVFECPYSDEKDKRNKISYKVIGRLFYIPYPKEIYLCFQHNVPQNIVEMAFKMTVMTIC